MPDGTNDGVLVLNDGTRIDPLTGAVVEEVRERTPIPTIQEIVHTQPAVRTLPVDLPAPPKQFNAICVIVGYTLAGMDDALISGILGIDVSAIAGIRNSDVYRKVFDLFVKQVTDSDQEYVRAQFTQGSKNAARKVIELVDSDNEATAFMAAKDVLDRSGHRPADVVEHRHHMEGGLRIEVIRKDETLKVPTIEMDIGGQF
jgi:hypothetical protein